jgi:hypothetical protein
MLFILVQIQAGPPTFAAVAASGLHPRKSKPNAYMKVANLPVDGRPKTLSRLRNLV